MGRLKRTVALVGMMGAGKSSIGRRLAARLEVPFRDADSEIEAAAGCTVAEIFAHYGEPEFRDGERNVIARLLGEPPHVLATGGGAFMDDSTRAAMKAEALSIWLKAPVEVLLGAGQAARHPAAAAQWRYRARSWKRLLARARSRSMPRPITVTGEDEPHGASVSSTSLPALQRTGHAAHERDASPSGWASAPTTSMSAPGCWRAPANC